MARIGVNCVELQGSAIAGRKYCINPYPANVDNMASSYQWQQMADGI